ncbi:hypothetical protein FHS27_000921 [Rhodopirellula rubra]|uniref:Uncharacterized protein n=1 Tax=Aporhodopirellula rubra TaxID=980271 RepID=A0A7W5DV79_9BACT|nr:hypothetical protein [Aporhodopirellula rubra]
MSPGLSGFAVGDHRNAADSLFSRNQNDFSYEASSPRFNAPRIEWSLQA